MRAVVVWWVCGYIALGYNEANETLLFSVYYVSALVGCIRYLQSFRPTTHSIENK